MSYSFALQTVHNEITLIQQRDISRVLLSVVFRVRSFYKAVCRLWGVWGHHWTESCCVPVVCDAQWLTYVNAVDDHSSATGPQHVLHYTQPLSSVVLALLLLLIVVRMWAEKLLHLSVEERSKSLRLHWKFQIVFSFIHGHKQSYEVKWNIWDPAVFSTFVTLTISTFFLINFLLEVLCWYFLKV